MSPSYTKKCPNHLKQGALHQPKKVPSKFPRIIPKNVPITLNRERYTSLKKYLANVPELYQKMSQSPNVGSVTPTLRAKDLRAMKLGVPPRTLWSNDQDPVLLVLNWFGLQGTKKKSRGWIQFNTLCVQQKR